MKAFQKSTLKILLTGDNKYLTKVDCIDTKTNKNGEKALASLSLMIVTDSHTHRMEIDFPIPPQVSPLRFKHQKSLKMKFHLK